MPLRYKVGDNVMVVSDISCGDYRNAIYFASGMEDYRGNIVTIAEHDGESYRIKEDGGYWTWAEGFFEDANETFIENNVVLLKNGQIRLVHDNALYLPNGKFIEAENYTDRKHNFDENFDIIEVHRKPSSNYLFDLSGELIQEEK